MFVLKKQKKKPIIYEWRLDTLGSTDGTPTSSSLDDGLSNSIDDEVDEEEADGGDIF